MRSLRASVSTSAPAAPAGFLWLWLASVLIPLATFAMVALEAGRAVDAEARSRIVRTVDMLREHAATTFEISEGLLDASIRRVQGMDWQDIAASREVHLFLKEVEQRVVRVITLGLVAPDGRIAASSRNPPPLPPTDLSARDYVRAHAPGGDRTLLSEDGTFITGIFETAPTGLTVLALSRPTLGADGKPDGGVASATLSPQNFTEFYARIAENPGDTVLLLRQDGEVLAGHPMARPAGTARLAADDPLMRAIAARASLGFVGAPASDAGPARRIAFRRIDGYPVYAAYGLDQAVIDVMTRRRLIGPAIVALLTMAVLLGITAHAQRSSTRRIAAEYAKAEVEAKLRQLERVGAFGELAAGVAHDFRNAAQVMESCARLLHHGADDPDKVREHAAMVAQSATRVATLTNRMLDIARRRPPAEAAGRFDAGPAVAELAALLNRTLGGGVRVAVRRSRHPLVVAADRSEFEAALVSLVVNARDALPRGGEVTLSVGDPPAGLDEMPAVGEVVVAVSDRGMGMDAETLARAGEPFFTTKRDGQGTGLGLAGARGFAERCGGRMTIRSRTGEGTIVALWLPAPSDPAPPGAAPPA